ncbi:MAG: hypothetical protein IPH88_12980 [Bacteroidales bacterium]|nr:hypothetical protein [Bacteroidales bacterium]
MRRLSSLVLLLILSWVFTAAPLFAQKSPHGENFKMSCMDCHKTDSWKVDAKSIGFNHSSTSFPLIGQHKSANCKDCHAAMNFTNAPTECNKCHIDVHEQTVGPDCSRCHTPNSWVVSNVTQLHQQGRFPLLGAHAATDCKSCHTNLFPAASAGGSASGLRFDPLGIECYDCHRQNFEAAKHPDHIANQYSTNCTECHNINAFTWTGAGVNHNFFPLTGGHETTDCAKCHTSGTYAGLSNECISCHQPDYASAQNPNHISLDFSTDCKLCHSLDPGWKPASFTTHDASYFPIYSGNHKGEWESCGECHTNPNDYGQFSCTDCHEHRQSKVDDEHGGVSGYDYNSLACYACHPTGSTDGAFNHSSTHFPLTGAHVTVRCTDCHTNGYSNTSMECSSCHINNFNQTSNPNHAAAGISEDCKACHTTDPGWKPAGFPTHANYYVLEGAHLTIANECAKCHNGNYQNTPNTCFACHETDFTQSTDPPHVSAQFPTTCEDCHNSTAWKPSTFNHDGQYFPIYSGKHNGEWNSCSECHTNPANYALYSCIDCHEHNQADTDDEHQGVGGYAYNSVACFECHPTGSSEGSFNHSSSNFPLTGGHAINDCASCHSNGYSGTTTVCANCHINNYNQTSNPNHNGIGISSDCAQCHTTGPGWTPASFPTHSNYYVIQGAHTAIATNCAACHQGNYTSTPNTCFGCHSDDYNQTTNPNHQTSQFSTECQSCHSQTAWVPSTFNHNNVYPLTGAHASITNCSLCHVNGYANTPTNCEGCHQSAYNQSANPNHQALGIPNQCATCHTTNPGWAPATFPIHNNYYVLAGAHVSIANQCGDCHNGNYNSTPNTCAGCHINNYNQTNDPDHQTAQFPTSCQDCHTQSSWQPSTFNHDSQYFPIYSGQHNGEWNTCSDCHPNPSNFGEFTCTTSCHPQSSTNNDHQGVSGYSYNSAACLNCHPNGNSDHFKPGNIRID